MSSNHSIETLITSFFHCLMEMSKKCEEARLNLNSCPDFDPFTLFRRLDVEQHKFVDESNFLEFLRINKIDSSVEENKYVILFYDSNSSRNLNYNEFLNMVLCKSYYDMKRLEESNQGYLSYETEKAFVNLLNCEINLIRNIGQILNEIKSTGQFNIQTIYQIMNSKSFLINQHFNSFFRSKGINATEEDIQCLAKRLDIKRNGKVSVTDIEKIIYFPYSKAPPMTKPSNSSYNIPKECNVYPIPQENKHTYEDEITFNRYNKYKSSDSPQKLKEYDRETNKRFGEEDKRRKIVEHQYMENDNENDKNVHLSSSSLYQVGKNKIDSRVPNNKTAETFATSYDKQKENISKATYSNLNQVEQKRYAPYNQGNIRENDPEKRDERRNELDEYGGNKVNNHNYSRYAYQLNTRTENEAYHQLRPMYQSREFQNKSENYYQRNNSYKPNEDEQYRFQQYKKLVQEYNEDDKNTPYRQSNYRTRKYDQRNKANEIDQYSDRNYNELYRPQSQSLNQENTHQSQTRTSRQKVNASRNKNVNSPIRISNTLALRLSPERKYINQDNQQEHEGSDSLRNNKRNYHMNQQEGDPNAFKEDQVILFLRTIMETETVIEKTKEDLAAHPDFNVDDTYSLFERDNKNMLIESDIKSGLNLFLLYPTKEELHLILSKYDLMKIGGINYSDFFDMVTPFDKNIRDIIENRIPKGIPSSENKSDIYSSATKTYLITLLRLLISSENRIESLRKKFSTKKEVTLKNVFSQMNQSNKEYITVYDLEKYLKQNGVVFNQKQVDLLYIRLDRNRDGRLSYEELANEFTSVKG